MLKKTIHASTRGRRRAISRPLHFQWLGAIENGGTSLCRKQAAEKQRFSTADWPVSKTRLLLICLKLLTL